MNTKMLVISVLWSICLVVGSAPAQAAPAAKSCQLVDVAVFGDRVHVHCGPQMADGAALQDIPQLALSGALRAAEGQLAQVDPLYFAVEANSPMASRIVDLGAWAVTSGRAVDIFYDDNAGINPVGCLPHDCRRLNGMALR